MHAPSSLLSRERAVGTRRSSVAVMIGRYTSPLNSHANGIDVDLLYIACCGKDAIIFICSRTHAFFLMDLSSEYQELGYNMAHGHGWQ